MVSSVGAQHILGIKMVNFHLAVNTGEGLWHYFGTINFESFIVTDVLCVIEPYMIQYVYVLFQPCFINNMFLSLISNAGDMWVCRQFVLILYKSWLLTPAN